MKPYKERMQEYLALINNALDKYLAPQGNEYDEVVEAMRYSVMNAGKRIRPILALEFCRLNGGKEEDVLPFACGLEMIHCYSLIHDDLPCMDDDDLRRGKPSCHKVYGEATALLAGDALLTKAFEVMSKSELGKTNPAAALSCIREMSGFAGVDGMVGGQIIDLKSEKNPEIAPELLSKIHLLKTSALIQAGCRMGAIAGGGAESAVENAGEYGKNLGLAFQIVDDILDVVGDEAELGKPIGSDAENQKVTFITLRGMEAAEKLAEEYTRKAVSSVEEYEDCGFLRELTLSMLTRKK